MPEKLVPINEKMAVLLPFSGGLVHVVNGDQIKLTVNGRLVVWDMTEAAIIAGCTEDGQLVKVEYSTVESAIRQDAPENHDARISPLAT